MAPISTLNDYRKAIGQATNSNDLDLLLYRALPLVYEDMGIAFEGHQHLYVATSLTRSEESWKLWFTIEAPQALNVLAHLDSSLFNRMNGTGEMASSITEGNYSNGFSKQTVDFSLEPVFRQQFSTSLACLNTAASLQSWWEAFYAELPWELVKARGWTEPSALQWQHAQEKVRQFRDECGDTLKSLFLLNGVMRDGKASCRACWSTRANDFSNSVPMRYYPLLGYHPHIALSNKGVFSMHVDNMELSALAKGIEARGKDIVFAHCSLTGTAGMPRFLLSDALAAPKEQEQPVELPNSLGETPAF